MSTESQQNPLELSDEDFLKTSAPPVVPASDEKTDEGDGNGNQEDQSQQQVEDPPADEQDGQDGDGGDGQGDNADDTSEDLDKSKTDEQKKADEEVAQGSGEGRGDGGNLPKDKSGVQKQSKDSQRKDGEKPASTGSETAKQIDYKAEYEKLLSPLHANGKQIPINSPEELIQLAQMGANYTRKMQQLAPQRKLLLMLENNNLLDPDKLSFLIDIEKRNPEAIKKLIKDAGMDPRDIDLDDPAANQYLPGNHSVSDAEANFRTALDELSSNPVGQETLRTIQTQWDQASKDELWKDPSLMTVVHQHRESGLYGRIADEVNRLRILGKIPANVPFIHAYKGVGDQMADQGLLDDILKPKPVVAAPPVEKTPVVTRTEKPKPIATNGDKVQAAATSRNSPKVAEPFINPLALSDEEFMKEHMKKFDGRL